MSYNVLIDKMEQAEWQEYASSFADHSIYQTWPYQQVRADAEEQELSRIVVKDKSDEVVAMSHVRIKHFKPLGLRVGYMQWGPLVLKKDGTCGCSAEVLNVLREAYLGNRVNVLRVVPNVAENSENQGFVTMLRESGFHRKSSVSPYHTMVLRLGRSEDELRKGLHQSWRRILRKAEAAGVGAREYTDHTPFQTLEGFYLDLLRRKGIQGVDPQVFARTQRALPESEKMSLVVAYLDGEPVSVHVSTNLGDSGILLLAASSEKGYECSASYVAWWKAVLISKSRGMKKYDVGGVDFEHDPGISRFKAGMGGEECSYIGAFEACTNAAVENVWAMSERAYRVLKRRSSFL
ncbi:MAG TPA: peptidoglycan bridge formation glycyltransferase FemA/FemB family protein [Sedimentisphaerales bacterium]|nr:peptidoglycan bridge formation glycyltransferase FemA/FemB family protein [Sedimentisphaerales bacterium]